MKPVLSFVLLVLSLLFVPRIAFSQKENVNPADILKQPAREIGTYDTSGFGEYQTAIRFPYGSPKVLNAADYDSIRGYSKISVEYIYTKYTQSQPGQKELDRNRFKALQKLAPDLFSNPSIHWEIMVQNSATTPEDANKLFHGFVITYQPPVTEERKRRIKTNFDNLLDCAKKRPPAGSPVFDGGQDSLQAWASKNIGFPVEDFKKSGESRSALVEFKINAATGKPENVKISGDIAPKYKQQIRTAFMQMPEWSEGEESTQFSVVLGFQKNASSPKITVSPLRGYDPAKCKGLRSDTLVSTVFDRNKGWDKMLVVEDVTGSMMPYLADLLLWNALKSNLNNVKHFVFFNDGDKKDDDMKVIGSTGGIYHATPKNIDLLEDKMIEAMSGGDGGDSPENDIEALLAGIGSCPDCQEIVLIADNTATPRDLKLVEKLGRPVHVVLCGAKGGNINPAHLYIAWKTKGSVHTIDKDITNLTNLQEGESIVLMGETFKIVKGQFVKVSKF